MIRIKVVLAGVAAVATMMVVAAPAMAQGVTPGTIEVSGIDSDFIIDGGCGVISDDFEGITVIGTGVNACDNSDFFDSSRPVNQQFVIRGSGSSFDGVSSGGFGQSFDISGVGGGGGSINQQGVTQIGSTSGDIRLRGEESA